MCPHDVLDLHEAGEIGALHLRKAHGDVLDGIREVGDEDVFQGIDPAPGPLYLLRQKLDALFRLGKLDHQRQGLGEQGERLIKVGGGIGKAVGEHIGHGVQFHVRGLDVHDRIGR